jgi:hypothetical protein
VTVAKAKQILPLPALLHREGLGDCAKKSARCPFHDDKHNSFSVYKNGSGEFRFKCFVGCGAGDEITFLEKRREISRSDATKLFIEMAGGSNGSAPMARAKKTALFDWQQCVDEFNEKQLEWLSDCRGYSGEFCSWLHKCGLVGLYDGHVAFPIRDESGKIVAAHYQLKNGNWQRYPIGYKTRPIVIGELVPGDTVHVFESQWDACAFMDESGERSGILVTLGAENGKLVAGLIPAAASVYAWKQNDELKNGKRAGDEWLRHVCEHAEKSCTVKVPKIPAPHKDLNDWTRAGATSDDLLQAMVLAETLREAEVSWIDALNAAVVTSSELHDLELIPRKKLLGDWFCEGDLGFIFAFRGVGKTWLALAIAQALSTGGKLGDWKALAPVKVLYVDGEMPPDLMRARCEGLQATNANLEFLNHEILFDRTGKTLNITSREVQQAITGRCVNSHAKVLILDNLSTLASGMKENEADSWELVNNWLLDLRRCKIAVVIVHHAGRSGEMRGTSKREDNVFWIIALDDAKKDADDKRGARFVSRFTKPSRNTQEEVPAFEWHLVTDQTTNLVSIGHKPAQTLEVFRSILEAGVSKPIEIAKEMKLPDYTISRLAKKAELAGWLKKSSRGEYVLLECAK